MEEPAAVSKLELFRDAAEAEVLVNSIIEELVIKGADTLYDHYLDEKNFPFAVKLTTGKLLNAAELHFIRRDLGEYETWPEEEEPQPCKIDAWGRGAVQVKKKYKLMQMRPPTSPYSGSVRSHITTFTRATHNIKSRLGARINQSKETLVEERVFVPVALPEQVIEVTPQETMLRLSKEAEILRKQQEEERIRLANQVEEERISEAAKRAHDLKSKPFTYDYEGRIMLQRQVKDSRPSGGDTEFKLITEEPLPTVNKRRQGMSSLKELPTVKTKKISNSAIEFVKNIQAGQPSLLDTIVLSAGVSIGESGKMKRSPQRSKAKTLTRNQYKKMTGQHLSETHSSFASSIPSRQAKLKETKERPKESKGDNTKSQVVTSNVDLLSEILDNEEDEVHNLSSQLSLSHVRGGPRKSKSSKVLSPITKFGEGVEEEEGLSEVDQFNFQLLKNMNWGTNPPIKAPKVHARLPQRPSEKNLQETLGYRKKLPRERPYIETISTRTRMPPPPLGKTMGHGLISVKSEMLASLKSLDRSLRL